MHTLELSSGSVNDVAEGLQLVGQRLEDMSAFRALLIEAHCL